MQFYINNVMNNNLYIEDSFEIPSLNTEQETREIQGRDGFLLGDKKVKGYDFVIPFVYVNHEKKDYQDIVNEIVEHMITDDEVRLRFENEYWYWNVLLSGTIQFKQHTQGYVEFELTCIITDPFKHSNELYNTVSQNDHLTLYNQGTAPSYPVIRATAKKDSTMFMISKNDEDYMMFGKSEDTERDTKNFNPVVYSSALTNTSGWTRRTTAIDDVLSGGETTGSLRSDGNALRINEWGEGAAWHGGALQRSLSRTINNFEFSTVIKIHPQANGVGVVKGFAHLADTQGNLVASIGLIDSKSNKEDIRVVVRIYDKMGRPRDLYNSTGGTNGGTAFRDGQIHIQLRKEGNKFISRTWRNITRSNGRKEVGARSRVEYTDKKGDYERDTRQLITYLAKHRKYSSVPVHMYKVTVKELLTKEKDKIPVVIAAGDRIEIDMKNELMLLNDEPVTDLKDFGANYYNVPAGLTEVFIIPEDTFDVQAEWRDRFY